MARESNDSRAGLLERPLTARSVVASLLLGRHPPSAPVSLLVRWCALFGISDTASRVALSRMVQGGELSGTDGVYELAGRVRGRQREQDFALEPGLGAWDGTWKIAVVASGSRPASERVELRRAMAHLRMVSPRDGVWTRPDNVPDDPHDADDVQGVLAGCTWFRGARPAATDLARLTAAFDLDAYERRTATLLATVRAVTAALPDPASLADGFVTGAAAAQHLRRDPLLPAELLPATWQADALRLAYRAYERAFGAAVRTWAGP